MSTRRIAALALAVALAVLALPALAAAGGQKTTVVVSLKFPAFHGALKSSEACEGGRTVTMYRKKGGPARKLGSGTSNAAGKWRVPVGKNLTSGEYFATVAKRGSCPGARSKTLTID